ncbi:MAG TPA: NAD(P)/FAD-dependent oxidoreductase [Thermoanaerobaculia bacterium]|nr:NAD(P)/FAD-dependent oxidoreductase [Thermoanaerobaculia bacterium]
MQRCDALVVGGGPAGSTVARALAAQGLDVVVADRAEFPRDKVCAGWITPAVLAELEVDPARYREGGRTLQPITGFRVGRCGGRAHEATYGETVSFGIRRCELDHYLLERAGARLRLGRAVRSLEPRPDGWLVDGEIETPLLIGAGGHGCPVARHLTPAGGADQALVVAQEIELRLDERQEDACAVVPESPELYFNDDLKGYGWCFRKGRYLNVGLGRLDRQGLQQHVREFVTWLRREGRIGFDLPAELCGHAYLLQGQRARSAVADRAILVGDALGLAYPASGEGIRPAVESGLLAARVVLEAEGRYERARLERYEGLLNERFGSARRRRRDGPSGWRLALARRLLASPWFVRAVVLDRWFLHRHQPPLEPERVAA